MSTYVRPWTTPETVELHRRCPSNVSAADIDQAITIATLVMFTATGGLYAGQRSIEAWRPDAFNVTRLGTLLFPVRVRPVVSIENVTIDGTTIDPSRYELRGGRALHGIDGEGGRLIFPRYQDLGRALGETGTWSIDFTCGLATPAAGVAAATEFAVQVLLGDQSDFPDKVQRVVREGVDITAFDPSKLLGAGMVTGIRVCDDFIRSVNPTGSRGRPTIINPDKVRPL